MPFQSFWKYLQKIIKNRHLDWEQSKGVTTIKEQLCEAFLGWKWSTLRKSDISDTIRAHWLIIAKKLQKSI